LVTTLSVFGNNRGSVAIVKLDALIIKRFLLRTSTGYSSHLPQPRCCAQTGLASDGRSLGRCNASTGVAALELTTLVFNFFLMNLFDVAL
jgi:hypothetical protein